MPLDANNAPREFIDDKGIDVDQCCGREPDGATKKDDQQARNSFGKNQEPNGTQVL